MKLSISTLGCPDWTFDQILDNYAALGIEGIEVRGIEGNVEPDKIPYFTEEQKEETLARVAAKGLKFIGFGTSASFHDAAKLQSNIDACKVAVDVCQRMGIPAVRVFGNNCPEGEGREETLKRIGEGIREVCRYANDKGVRINLEIHGTINTVDTVAPIIEIASSEPSFGILWDVQHSDKTVGDDFEEFYQTVKPYLRHVHIKDHLRASEPPFKLVAVGEGDIPLKKIIRRLLDDGYDGYFSLEWEKKWHPELAEPEAAFPAYVEFMKEFM